MSDRANELSQGWTESPLRKLLTSLESGSRPKGGVRGIREGVPSVGAEHLTSSGGFDFTSIKYVPELFHSAMKRGHISRGDVLVVKDGATTGKVSIVREDFPFSCAVVNEHVFVCRPGYLVDSAFLFWFLWSSMGRRRILENFQGSAQGGINQSFADEILIPLAPLAEQRRIVAAAEALVAQVDTARQRLAKVPAILKHFRQAVLTAACSGKLTEEWREQCCDTSQAQDVVDEIRGKWQLRPGRRRRSGSVDTPRDDRVFATELPPSWLSCETASLCDPDRALTYGVIKLGPAVRRGVPTLRSSDVRWLLIDDSDVKRISPAIADQYRRTRLRGSEVLVTVRGTLGGVAVVPPEMAGFNVSREVAVIPFDHSLNARYFALAIASLTSQNWLAERAKGVAYTGINIEDIKLLPLPVPPRREQDEIVRRVETFFSLADAVERRLGRAAARTDRLTQAILAKAFRGELVATEAELSRRDAPGSPGVAARGYRR